MTVVGPEPDFKRRAEGQGITSKLYIGPRIVRERSGGKYAYVNW